MNLMGKSNLLIYLNFLDKLPISRLGHMLRQVCHIPGCVCARPGVCLPLSKERIFMNTTTNKPHPALAAGTPAGGPSGKALE
ncbi:hypothetical protein, partial [Polaromonas aquatica]